MNSIRSVVSTAAAAELKTFFVHNQNVVLSSESRKTMLKLHNAYIVSSLKIQFILLFYFYYSRRLNIHSMNCWLRTKKTKVSE